MVVIASAAHGCRDSRLEAATSGLPTRLLVLPVSARTLAGIAFLWATLPLFLAALLYTRCIIRPIANDAPLFWPGLLLATLARWPTLSLPWQSRPQPRSFSSPFRALFWLRRRARFWSFLVMCAICMLVCWPAVWFLEKVLLDETWLQAYLDVSHMSRSMGVAWL